MARTNSKNDSTIGADVSKRRFSQSQYDMLKRCSDKKDMTEWNEWREGNPDEDILLERANLWEFNLEGVELRHANLQGANLSEANLQGANVSAANMQDANLQDAILQGARLWHANLQGANLSGANMQGARFRAANMQGADLQDATLQGAGLWNADLQGADLCGAELENAYLTRANLEGANLNGANLEGAKLEGAKLQGAIFWEAKLQSANLRETHLQGAKLMRSYLQGAEFGGAKLQEADFSRAIVDGETLIWRCEIDRKTKFEGVGLGNVRIYPKIKQLLEYNIRCLNWEEWYKYKDWDRENPEKQRHKISQFFMQFIRAFWWISDYGMSTWRIIWAFFWLATIFAVIYFCIPGLVHDLHGTGRFGLDFIRACYFSVVTMTTLGFGDMFAQKGSYYGHILLMIQVLLGYILLAALVTRFAVLFTAGGPAGKFAEMDEETKKKLEEIREKRKKGG